MSLPMPSGSCWTKRTTESNRKAPEILRGFFAPYPPADASCRTSGHTPPNPLTADLPVTQAQSRPARYPRRSPVSSFPHGSPIQLPPCPQSKTRRTPRFPITQAQTHTTQPHTRYSRRSSAPIPAHLSSSSDLYKNPGSRPPPGFFVISGSVRSPLQQRLR